MARVPTSTGQKLTPKTVRKLDGRRAEKVAGADFGVFAVERLRYDGGEPGGGRPPPGRDVFVFACPDWCNVIAETEAGEVVMIWQYRFGTDAVGLEVPAGVIDPGETPEEAARRELREETGYEVGPEGLELLAAVEPNPALQGNRCFTFLARGVRATGETAFDELEELETVLVPRSDVAGLIDDGTVTHALVIVGLERYLRKAR